MLRYGKHFKVHTPGIIRLFERDDKSMNIQRPKRRVRVSIDSSNGQRIWRWLTGSNKPWLSQQAYRQDKQTPGPVEYTTWSITGRAGCYQFGYKDTKLNLLKNFRQLYNFFYYYCTPHSSGLLVVPSEQLRSTGVCLVVPTAPVFFFWLRLLGVHSANHSLITTYPFSHTKLSWTSIVCGG